MGDMLCIHHDAENIIRKVDEYFHTKPGSIDDPDIYIGTKLRKVRLPNGVVAWAIIPIKYINDAVNNMG